MQKITKDIIYDQELMQELAILSLQNCVRLHCDSYLLYKNKSYPSAYFMSVMALEELGKMKSLNILAYLARVYNNNSASMDYIFRWFKRIYSHTDKQHNSINYSQFYEECISKHPLLNDFFHAEFTPRNQINPRYKHILSTWYDEQKQSAMYVGIEGGDGFYSASNPSKDISGKLAREQISIVQELLMMEILAVKKDEYYYDSLNLTYYVLKHGTRIYNKLKSMDIPISREYRRIFAEKEAKRTITKRDFY